MLIFRSQLKTKRNNGFEPTTNNFDSTLDRNLTVHEVNGSEGKARPPGPAESNPKPALTPQDLILVQKSNPSKIFFPRMFQPNQHQLQLVLT